MHRRGVTEQVLDSSWMAHLSPMSRLLIMAGLTSVGTNTIHFIDADRAIFSYPPKQQPPPALPQIQQTNNAATAANLRASENQHGREDQENETVATGGGKEQENETVVREEQENGTVVKDEEAELEEDRPPPGQVGLLQFNSYGRGTEFILSPDQSLPERLTLSAEVEIFAGDSGGEEYAVSRGGVRGEGFQRGGEAASGTGGGGGGRGVSPSVCVKYLSTVGTAAVQRIDWFPRREDALSLRQAIDVYCPIPWLRDGGGLGSTSERVEAVGEGGGVHKRYRRRIQAPDSGGEGGGGGGGGGGRGGEGVRRLLLYQRDQNRKMVHVGQVRKW